MNFAEHWEIVVILATVFGWGVGVLVFAEKRFVPRTELEPRFVQIEKEQKKREEASHELRNQLQAQTLLMTKLQGSLDLIRQEIRFLRRELGSKVSAHAEEEEDEKG